MDPATIAMLTGLVKKFGPAALSKLFGDRLFGHDHSAEQRARILALISPQNLDRMRAAAYQQNISSPA